MKRLLTFILSICLLCGLGSLLGCNTEKADNTNYTAFLEFTEIKDGDKVTGYSVKGKEGSTEKNIVIPATYNGKPVEIASEAFSHNEIIESVVVKNGVNKIGRLAFSSCKKLYQVTLSNSMTELASGAFINCTALEEITLPKSIKTVNDQAFVGCTALKSITLSREHIVIQQRAFDKCENLKKVYWYEELPEGADGTILVGDMDIDTGNDCFYTYHATWYHYSKEKPIYDPDNWATYYNSYWHYDDNGQKVIWKKI